MTDVFPQEEFITVVENPSGVTVLRTMVGGEVVSDHGALEGLEDDDHVQYLNQERADERYAQTTTVNEALNGKSDNGHTHPVSELTATGTRNNTTFLRGDNTWAVPEGTGGGGTSEPAPVGNVVYQPYTNGASFVRPSTDPDVLVIAIGPEPVPPSVVPPATNGLYENDLQFTTGS